NDTDMLAFMQNLMNVLPLQSRTEEKPPVGDEATEEARTWAEEEGRQAIRFVHQHAIEGDLDPNRIRIAGLSAGGGVVMGAVMKQQRKPGLGRKKTVAKPFVSYVNTPADGTLIRIASE